MDDTTNGGVLETKHSNNATEDTVMNSVRGSGTILQLLVSLPFACVYNQETYVHNTLTLARRHHWHGAAV